MLATLIFFTDTPTTEIYTLSLHDALPISRRARGLRVRPGRPRRPRPRARAGPAAAAVRVRPRGLLHDARARQDRKSTRLNSSHTVISYAVFCLKKKIQVAYSPHSFPPAQK